MKNLVEVITKALVDNPEGVVVTEKQEGKTTVIEVHVSDNDMGKVIGKHMTLTGQSWQKDSALPWIISRTALERQSLNSSEPRKP